MNFSARQKLHKMNFWDEMELQKRIFHGKIPKNAGKTEEKSCKTAGEYLKKIKEVKSIETENI